MLSFISKMNNFFLHGNRTIYLNSMLHNTRVQHLYSSQLIKYKWSKTENLQQLAVQFTIHHQKIHLDCSC